MSDAQKAELLLHPLRQRILSEAREASSAADIARRVGLPAQRVNYHVRTLADAGFLRPAGEGRKRNLVEKLYRASARSYLLLPEVLGEMSPSGRAEADRFSAVYLMHLSALLQKELGTWLAREEGPDDVPTLSMEAELRFDSPEQRATFADALQNAVSRVIGQHTSPARDQEGRTRPGRLFRLVLGCYPVPHFDKQRPGPGADEPDRETR